MKYIFLLIGSIFVLSCGNNDEPNPCVKKTCSDFKTQSEAKAALESNRDCYSGLDSDNDGKPCENLPQ